MAEACERARETDRCAAGERVVGEVEERSSRFGVTRAYPRKKAGVSFRLRVVVICHGTSFKSRPTIPCFLPFHSRTLHGTRRQ